MAYRLLCRTTAGLRQSIQTLVASVTTEAGRRMVAFLLGPSSRGIAARGRPNTTDDADECQEFVRDERFVAEESPKLSRDRYFAPDIAASRKLVVSGALRVYVTPGLFAR